MSEVTCPDCGAPVETPFGIQSGDLVECPNCAGHALRVWEQDGRWSATVAHRVSCPECGEVITLPEDVNAGDTLSCCDQTFKLTFEFGAFAAEKTSGD